MQSFSIEIDDRSGFCFGVVRAIEMAERALSGGELVSLGDIVHNSAEVARLERLGLTTAPEDADLADFMGRRVLIRAHGEPPATYRNARELGIELIDATCPVVAQLQKTVAEASFEQVVIFGKKGHAEIRGLVGQTNKNVIIIEDENDLWQIDFARPIFFLAQTTSSLSEFERLGEIIRRKAADPDKVVVKDTVCRQVADREKHLAEFARRMDVVVFVAGAKSSNGRVLFEAVRAANPQSYKIENAEELRPEWFIEASSVGICGATSTPRWLMQEIAQAISCND